MSESARCSSATREQPTYTKRNVQMSALTVCPNDTCERCGFVPTYMCQLDVFHMCGDAQDPSNYMTLCLNCQRLQEAMRGDYLSPAEAAELKGIWRQGYIFN